MSFRLSLSLKTRLRAAAAVLGRPANAIAVEGIEAAVAKVEKAAERKA